MIMLEITGILEVTANVAFTDTGTITYAGGVYAMQELGLGSFTDTGTISR